MTLTVIWESPGHVLDPASGATKYIFSDPSQADNPEIPPVRTGGAPQWGIGDGQIWLGGNMATLQLSGSQLFWHCVKDIVKNTSDEYWRVAITCRWLAFGQDMVNAPVQGPLPPLFSERMTAWKGICGDFSMNIQQDTYRVYRHPVNNFTALNAVSDEMKNSFDLVGRSLPPAEEELLPSEPETHWNSV